MAWTEAALEEMGLAQIWVRRGQRADGETGVADAGAVGATAALQADVVADGGAAVAAATTARQPRPAAAQSDRAPDRDAGATPADAPRGAVSARVPADAPPQAAAPASDAMRRDAADAAAHRELADARASAQRQPAASTEPMPPALDAPPAAEDDFAWFDAAPPGDPVAPAESRAAQTPVAMLDWDALAARVADCTRCRLCEKRTNTVFGVGDREADWMLVGEAPGENEDKQGEPFVGQAGKLLDNMLRSLSLERGRNVYIANVIKCRPPGNRNPEPDEVARCEPYLQRQVALVKPKLIVALGRFAAQTLLKTDASIASLRGRVHAYEGVPVIVTYHPAYLLRSLQDKSKAWADLCLARDTFGAAAGADAQQPAGQ
ncbi:uracil-DNA glycosylase [Burkholderia pseudomultivorans]|uniref:Type-4 uracil-DNA glycosylase n=3 Tax=Burkholderia pseudomultivorans TaxID=1207504 RepID=A0ABU2DXD7_9BURK|nr:uracil-DNA glycosylase [Burkholderia pseudomultivorans]MDR8731877.1 Type-4 uracil-DNA glycosylase [Burkholderia pseudomultivorans]MDR8733767.1 Type-4 uracil-DNA glycosylase [Burkholderia pseudomultivorans]MDR8745576.1 Type-4 uracil-DNA glycosylase [Burkholderia pseudomultivorans]MDR8752261.1 Type-4 uracil-DNA glycosylase [Burkholderia pseudomultivorans]MDR8778241.1 Type-4 uracil-DNA glycosylase [Burkholderia pseudomultivorans]